MTSLTKDVSTVGKAKYERKALDFYPTPSEVTWSIFDYLPEDKLFWEPCCGDGAISTILMDRNFTYSSDIHNYQSEVFPEGVDLINFLGKGVPEDILEPTPLCHGGVCIVTNPPYDKSHEFVKRFFEREEVNQAFFLLRHEWDASQKSFPFVNHTWFKTKYVLKRRPRWIKDSTVSPRFPYAWYEWDKNNTKPCTTLYGVSMVED